MSCPVQPDPDIAGLGVRISFYIQGMSAFFTTIIHLLRGRSMLAEEVDEIYKTHFVMHLTAFAILITACIKYSADELSTYHGIMTLNYMWLTYLATNPFFPIMSWLNLKEREFGSNISSAMNRGVVKQLVGFSGLGLFAGVFGFKFWFSLSASTSDCTPDARIWIFGNIHTSSNPHLRIAYLVLYILLAIPLVLLFIWVVGSLIVGTFVMGLLTFFRSCFTACLGTVKEFKLSEFDLAIMWLPTVCLIPIMVAATELTVQANQSMLTDHSEDEWSFGQIAALGIALIPVLSFYEDVKVLWRQAHYQRHKSQLQTEFGNRTALEFHRKVPHGQTFEVSELSKGSDRRQVWAVTSALSKEIISSPPSIQLFTFAQGQFNWGGKAWFEIGIISPADSVNKVTTHICIDTEAEPSHLKLPQLIFTNTETQLYQPKVDSQTGKELTWTSHELKGRLLPFDQFQEGQIFPPSHPIWQHTEEGDIFCIYQCVGSARAANTIASGHLILFRTPEQTSLNAKEGGEDTPSEPKQIESV